ncbi:hypothetical protein [Streptomyces sp. IBSBF 2435]|uniref:hypothetical protein n=1 Tax=Streptomyces sp. IBSBF 2435 TaxID=2903531 RepID=UPI002FDC654A
MALSTQMIGYDLNRPGQKYEALADQIKKISNGTWWHKLDSTWFIRTELNSAQVCKSLQPYVDGNDELLVINVTGDSAAWIGFDSQASDWLKNNL